MLLFFKRVVIIHVRNKLCKIFLENKKELKGDVMAEARVSKETLIGELLQIDADIAPILMGIGMHCLGCPASQMESLEEAAAVHGINADDLVDEINNFLASK